jgi:ATP-dependent Clp protease adapter protein ClpS
MRDVPAGVRDAQIIVYDDHNTRLEFAVDLIRSVFGRSKTDAFALAATSNRQGKAVCGAGGGALRSAVGW